jgi:hypothetical protein
VNHCVTTKWVHPLHPHPDPGKYDLSTDSWIACSTEGCLQTKENSGLAPWLAGGGYRYSAFREKIKSFVREIIGEAQGPLGLGTIADRWRKGIRLQHQLQA